MPEPPSTGPDESPRTATSGTDRPPLRPSGDPAKVAKVFGGLLLMATGALSLLVARRTGGNRVLRQPTPAERDDIARPLARIAVRHLPMDLIGDDLADLTEAIVAGHEYVMAGPITHEPDPAPFPADEFPDDDQES